jgi:hypothetical protein
MNETQVWIGLLLGLVPYRLERQYLSGGKRKLQIRALFWSLTLYQRRNGRCDWILRIPLIERSRDAAWAAVIRLRGTDDDLSQQS